jgi:hypothetical protein
VISNARLLPTPVIGDTAAPPRPRVQVRFRRGRIASLVVTRVPAGATVSVTCKGRCPKRGVRRSYATATARANLTRLVRAWRPRQVTVRVKAAAPGLSLAKTVRAPRRGGSR